MRQASWMTVVAWSISQVLLAAPPQAWLAPPSAPASATTSASAADYPAGTAVSYPNGYATAPATPTAALQTAAPMQQATIAAPGSATHDAMAADAPPKTTLEAIEARLNEVIQRQTGTTYPTIKVNGVFQADMGFFSQDKDSLASYGRIQDGASFRRARLATSGAVTETMNYFFQMDFAFFGRPTFTDLWIEQTDLPLLGTVRVGQWKQPFSLEVVSSFRYTTFMERSLVFQPFTPFRHLGVGFYNRSDDLSMTWAASAFRTGQDQFGDSISTDRGWGTAERITYLPFYDEPADGRYYLHLGAGHFFSSPPGNSFNFRTIPELFVGENAAGAVGTSGQAVPGALNGTPFFVATGPLGVQYYNVLGSELLWVNGPLSVQSEWMVNFVNRIGGKDAIFPGGYMQIGYFLTGEHRPYDRRAGAIDRIRPFENFFRVRTSEGPATGWGAWELALRGSHINLNDQGVQGGAMTDVTFGINWFLNPYSKLVFNYIHSMVQSPASFSTTHIFGTMAQVDF